MGPLSTAFYRVSLLIMALNYFCWYSYSLDLIQFSSSRINFWCCYFFLKFLTYELVFVINYESFSQIGI